MSNNIVVDDSVKITVKFVDIDSNGNQVEVSVDSIILDIIKSDGTIASVNSSEIIQLVAGNNSSFYYIFTPTIPDTYTLKFTGLYSVSGTVKSIVVEQKLYVSSVSEDYRPTVILGSNETITFAGDITPLYLDPDEIMSIFPDATPLEVAEIINKYSNEILYLYESTGSVPGSEVNFKTLEYIRAATACELSRTYGFGGDDEMSLTLGDFSITNKSIPRAAVNRDNATTWCQLATMLRKEILSLKAKSKAMQPKGLPVATKLGTSGKNIDPVSGRTVYLSDLELYGPGKAVTYKDDPMPRRGIRSYD